MEGADVDRGISMEGISKRFPGVTALNRVSVEFAWGEVHALLGENGAGKTTLMNILYGLVKPEEGCIYVDGRPIAINSSQDAIANGIGMIHQHFMLIPKFTVLENIIVGTPSRRGPLLDLSSARSKIEAICDSTGLRVDLDSRVMDLSVGDQQRVEIIKALYKGARVLIMDEPTAVLTPREADELFVALSRWTQEGNTVIFITHKIREVLNSCQRITVLRDGECMGSIQSCEADYAQIAKMMVGRDLTMIVNPRKGTAGKQVFEVKNLVVESEDHVERVRDVSFAIREGEILGIAGVDGNGQLELVESILGLIPVRSGDALLEGRSIKGLRPDQVLALGVSNVPFKRQSEGLAMEFSIQENYMLKDRRGAPFAHWGFLQMDAIREQARRIIGEYRIKANGPETKVANMSGGNQQKVVIARELERKPTLLIACHPTHGLDVGAIEYIHGRLLEQKAKGTAILLISTELDELLALSDRILVLYKGGVMGEVLPSTEVVERIGLMMLGKKV